MEGPMHGRRMRRALVKRGYSMVPSSALADVIISHSGGYLLLPPLNSTQTLLAIDPSLDRSRSQLSNGLAHTWYDLRHVLPSSKWYFWIEKSLLNWFYLASNFGRMTAISHAQRRNDNYDMLRHSSTITTKSRDKSWRSSDPVFAGAKHFKACHDDCWLHPEPYLDLLP